MEKAAAAWGPLPRTRIRTYFKKMYARPIYRLLLVLLGLPTALMVLVKHLVFSSSASYDKLRADLEAEFKANGLLEKLKAQALESERNKSKFLKRSVSDEQLKARADKVAKKKYDQALQEELTNRMRREKVHSPDMLLAIAIIAAFGANTVNLILALSIGSVAVYARTVRATVLGLANAEFVEAARSCGARDWNIIFRHIIPNSLAPIIVRSTMGIGTAVLSTSSLSYLGLGVEPHIPEWGNILKIGSQYLETNPYLAIFPGLAIILLVLAFNFFGDGLRDALDPKLK